MVFEGPLIKREVVDRIGYPTKTYSSSTTTRTIPTAPCWQASASYMSLKHECRRNSSSPMTTGWPARGRRSGNTSTKCATPLLQSLLWQEPLRALCPCIPEHVGLSSARFLQRTVRECVPLERPSPLLEDVLGRHTRPAGQTVNCFHPTLSVPSTCKSLMLYKSSSVRSCFA